MFSSHLWLVVTVVDSTATGNSWFLCRICWNSHYFTIYLNLLIILINLQKNTRSVQKVFRQVIRKRETFTEKDTINIVHRTMTPQSPSEKQAFWDLTQFSQLPTAALLYFPESHQWSETSSLSKVILVLGKARSHRAPNLGCWGTESSGWFDVSQKKKKFCTNRDAWVGVLLWWSCQSITSCP